MVDSRHRYWHRRGYLPHFDAGGITQSVTFRLADSLPPPLRAETKALDELGRRKRVETLIDEGYGSCVLRQRVCAEIVSLALSHFDGAHYRLLAWVVMPNHVHAMIEQMDGWPLAGIVQGWKSVSARNIGRLKGTKGTIWAADYHDRFIRNATHYTNAIAYIEENPVKAGLVGDARDWPFSSLGSRHPLGPRTPPSARDLDAT